MERLNVLLVNNGYPSNKHRNYCTYIKSIEECLKSCGYNIDILSVNLDYSKIVRYIKFYKDIIIKDLAVYDVIYINHWSQIFIPFLFKKLSKKKIIVNFHGSDLIASSKVKNIINLISNLFIPSESKIIVPSNYFYKMAKKVLGKNEIFIIPSAGVNSAHFFLSKEGLQKSGEKLILGFVSGVTERKGCNVILDLMQEIKSNALEDKFQIKVVKYGADINKFLLSISEKGLDELVSFEDIYEKKDMGKLYSSIDYLLLPSKGESLGLVGLESLACGTPVIGSNNSAIPEYVINGKTGFLFKEGDHIELFNKIILLLNKNNSEYIQMQEQSVDLIKKKYSKDECIKNYKNIFNTF